jgi:hypothetical protein
MPPNILPVMSMQSSDSSMMTTVTTNSYGQMPAPPMHPMHNKEEMINSSDITEVTMGSDNTMNETKAESNQMSSNAPLLPPPLPPFQGVPPLGMPPMPPLLGNHPSSMPWLSGPPPPIIPGSRMPGMSRLHTYLKIIEIDPKFKAQVFHNGLHYFLYHPSPHRPPTRPSHR